MTTPGVSTRLANIASALEGEASAADRPDRREVLASLADEVRRVALDAEEASND